MDIIKEFPPDTFPRSATDIDNELKYNNERIEASKVYSQGLAKHEQGLMEEEIVNDELFQQASRRIAEHTGGEISEDPQEMAKIGLQTVSDYLIPLTTVDRKGLAGMFGQFNSADPETKAAMYYMAETWNNKEDTTMSGFKRGLKSVSKDPTMIGGLGYGFFGRMAVKQTAKRALMETLGVGLSSAGYFAGEEAIMQGLEGKDEYDWEAIGEEAGLGAGMGATLALGMPVIAKGFGMSVKQLGKVIDDAMQGRDPLGNDLLQRALTMGKTDVAQEGASKSIYHGTAKKFKDFDIKKSADGTIWFTDNKSKIEKGEVSASGKGYIMEKTIDENNLKLGGWEEQDKFSTDELINMGYDGIRLKDGDETTYQIFYPEKLGAASQQGGVK